MSGGDTQPAGPDLAAGISASTLADGAMLGPDQRVILHLIEIRLAMGAMECVSMDLDDGAHNGKATGYVLPDDADATPEPDGWIALLPALEQIRRWAEDHLPQLSEPAAKLA